MFLNREELRTLIEERDLISGYPHLETQLQPNGFDVTVNEVHDYAGAGKLDFSNDERVIPDSDPVEPEKQGADDDYGWWALDPGAYKIVMNEHVTIPNDLVGVAFPRSSLLRMGAYTQTAFWDAGYSGGGTFLLQVNNPDGIHIKENARITQLSFLEMDATADGYDGAFHADNA